MDTIVFTPVLIALVVMCLRWDIESHDRWLLHVALLANLALLCLHVYMDGSHLYYEFGSNYLP